ncbi:hypothetical protein TSTA_059270 [Talaromyces stipitatus ATCC 10500]|uniref:F-box domain-containing protein n=1 Tax=Talaromyces stipitatus (strain ATCC 10500 / CBS 375.48 / QM 6759 / NRRL 1006) TaxID=441959 RepID=B8MQL8_TALSN|nr:uncharacterized protein TSTA_059270 [Talaromyces stipitatus ATCC 10500]EED13441.1 hypothetical protein TSTA_059270 [Talaromyces stipitatus ATCC 10500]
MAQGESPNRPRKGSRQNNRQSSAPRQGHPRQGHGQQESAQQSTHHRQASGEKKPQTGSHQKATSQTSSHQGSGPKGNNHQNAGYQRHRGRQGPNNRPSKQQAAPLRNDHTQNPPSVASTQQDCSEQNSDQKNHGLNAQPETAALNTLQSGDELQTSDQSSFGQHDNHSENPQPIAQQNSEQDANQDGQGPNAQAETITSSTSQKDGPDSCENNSVRNDCGQPKHQPDAQVNQQNDNVKARRLTSTKMIHNLTKEWSPEIHRNFQPFTMLPPDIILEIMDHLHDPVDKTSLALTTKSLWVWMKDKLHLERYNLPHVLPARATLQHGMIKPWPFFKYPRWKLLERLEDHNWKCCSGCLMLHPKTEFFSEEIGENPPKKRLCRAPGLIHICPHIALTYKKVEALKKALADFAVARKESGRTPEDDSLSERLYHHCHFMAGPHKIMIGAQPFISGTKNDLYFRQRYVLEIKSEKVRDILKWIGKVFPLPNLCPHRGIVTHCLDMLVMLEDENSSWDIDMILGNDASFFNFEHHVRTSSKGCRIVFESMKRIGAGYDLKKGKAGHANPHHLQDWVDKTDVANTVIVEDCGPASCKCRYNCRKIRFDHIPCPSHRASLPETTWKNGASSWVYSFGEIWPPF